MNGESISPLRRRMIEDMTVRKFVEKTQKDYIRHVKSLTTFLGRSPDTATAEDLRRYQLHLTESGIRPPSINSERVAVGQPDNRSAAGPFRRPIRPRPKPIAARRSTIS